MIKLKKSDYSDGRLRKSAEWLTHDHWAVKLDSLDPVANAETLALAGQEGNELPDAQMARVIPPKDGTKEYRATGRIQNETRNLDPNHDVVVFESGGTDKPAGFARKYIRAFGLSDTLLYGKDEKSTFMAIDENDKPWLVLMPRTIPQSR